MGKTESVAPPPQQEPAAAPLPPIEQTVETISTTAITPAAPAARFVDPVDRYQALIVRGTIIGVGLAGVALFLKNSRIFARFEHVGQIPKEFIRKELELKGQIREILPGGELKILHEPIVPLPSVFRKKLTEKTGLLNVRLAGVDISEAGKQFMAKDLRLKNKPIVFTVIKQNNELPDTIDCDVTVKRNFITRTNLNIELVRRGYARVPAPDHPRHLKALQNIPAYSRLVSRLLMSEKVAERRGVGVWERDTWVESVQSYPSQAGQMIRNAAVVRAMVLLFNVTRDVIIYGAKIVQQTYALILATFASISRGYGKFSRGVDDLTTKYNNMKNRIKQ